MPSLTFRPLTRADLPAASYTEMTEWALPAAAAALGLAVVLTAPKTDAAIAGLVDDAIHHAMARAAGDRRGDIVDEVGGRVALGVARGHDNAEAGPGSGVGGLRGWKDEIAARAMGIIGTGYQLGGALTFVVAGWAADTFGWRGALFVPSALLVASAVLIARLVDRALAKDPAAPGATTAPVQGWGARA